MIPLSDPNRSSTAWLNSAWHSLVLARVEEQAETPAVLAAGFRLTYGELAERSLRVGAHLRDRGLAPGDRALLLFRNDPTFVEAYLGCVRAGIVPVTCHPGVGWDGASRVATAADVRAVLTDGSAETRAVSERLLAGLAPATSALRFGGEEAEALYRGPAPAAPRWEPDPSSPLVVLVSSGSTGAPKLVARSHGGFGGASRRFGELWGARPGVRFAIGSMVGHAAGLGWGVQAALMAGATLVIPVDRRPAPMLEAMARLEAQVVFLVPSQGRALLAAARAEPSLAAPSLRRIIFGGERLEPMLAHGLRERFGVEVQNTYGMTEGFCTSTDPASFDDIDRGSVGRPCFAEDELRVLDEAGAEVAAGEAGELWVRGPAGARGYLGLPNDPRFSPDGFFRTGDIVRRLPDGRLVYLGRVSTLINRGGIKVSPEELEYRLQQHPGVEQAVVVGVRDETLGERVHALVRPRAALTSVDELERFLASRGVGRSLLPDRIHLVGALPLNSIGKLDRRAAAGLAATLINAGGAGLQDAHT